ncbi:MAG: hypothetical protein AB8G16_16910 [Gammaproteobacteria bacterium]
MLRFVGVVGALLFGFVLYLTFSTPQWLETYAKDYIEDRVRERVGETIDAATVDAGDSALGRLAASVVEANSERIDKIRDNVKNKVYERMAQAIGDMRNADCTCRAMLQSWAQRLPQGSLNRLFAANTKITELIQGKYAYVVGSLKRDVRIFAGTNFAVFLSLLLVTFMKPRAMGHLVLPAFLLTCSTVLTSYFYIFQQNWLLTILHSSYWGWAYTAYLALVFAILLDIVFNKARVTTEIVNGILNAIGSSLSVFPC